MNACKKCGVEIQDGMELCENCLAGEAREKEHYLDDLLQSVDMEPVQTRLEDLSKQTKIKKDSIEGSMEELGERHEEIADENTMIENEIREPTEESSHDEEMGKLIDEAFLEDKVEEPTDEASHDEEMGKLIDEAFLEDEIEGPGEEASNDDGMEGRVEDGSVHNETGEPINEVLMDEESNADEETGEMDGDLEDIDNLLKDLEDKGLLLDEEESNGVESYEKQDEESNPEGDMDLNINEISGLEDIFGDTLSAISNEMDEEGMVEDTAEDSKEEDSPKKPNLFQRLFGNIVDEKEIKKAAEEKKKTLEKEILKQEQDDKKKVEEEEKAKNKEATKEEKEKFKLEKKQLKIEAKEEKKRKKKEKKELEALNEEDMVEGRLNKAGATIVFMIVAALVVLIVTGTLSQSYNQAIETGNEYFAMGEYENAYRELNGVKLREKDERVFQQLKLIMHIQRERQSSGNFMAMKMYPESLDALLEGLRKYEEHLPYAKELGVEDILNELKEGLLKDLNERFHISEKAASEINAIEDQTEYTGKILEIIKQNNLIS